MSFLIMFVWDNIDNVMSLSIMSSIMSNLFLKFILQEKYMINEFMHSKNGPEDINLIS